MNLSRLLATHTQFTSKYALATNLGDGYLLEHNKVYRNIRLASLEAGFKFSDAYNNFYQALPYTQLDQILKSKIIPYVDNVSVLKPIVERAPDANWDDVSDGLKKNHVFHEACHVVARILSEKHLKKPNGKSKDEQRTLVLIYLLEESFANACELLAIAEVEQPAHKIFYYQNSYSALFDNRSLVKNLFAELSDVAVLQFMILAYLHANFMFERLDDRQFDRIEEIVFSRSLDAKTKKPLRALAKLAFTLDPRFRTVTTSLHLRLAGISLKAEDFFGTEVLNSIEREMWYQTFLADASAVVFRS